MEMKTPEPVSDDQAYQSIIVHVGLHTCLKGASSVFGFKPIFLALAGQFGVPCCMALASLQHQPQL